MNTEPQKPSPGLKLVYTIVRVFIVCFIGFLGLLLFLDLKDFLTPSLKLAGNSPLVILTRVDTNAPTQYLVITEIWRQPKDISSPSVKVGAKLAFKWGSDSGAPPDGLVICYRRSFPLIETGRFTVQQVLVVRQGRINNMTVEEFKNACGLSSP